MQILVVEDDQGVADALTQALRRRGWSVRHAPTGAAALDLVDKADLVLLDMGLPDHDGLWVCRQIRAHSSVPIVALTARRNEGSVIGALHAGVDDYVTKPYSLAILLARLDAVVRRTVGRDSAAPTVDLGFVVDESTRSVTAADGSVRSLTTKECELLVALARTPDHPLSRAALMEEVWDTTWVGASRTLDVHVASLRNKLRGIATIDSVRGVGYRLSVADPTDP
ncbi:hypothetical protein ASG56_03585 [Rhodococcus sp. Leaf7]|uniref:response regulator transcription factor n=1 Tax=unclassified Rhodococcus (in: high G+C Gram-positive bacteria) TaxID=192944 RepID=UPI0006FE8CF3|nr:MULTISPECIES: response regulator transcription factor [unclassified Rhodococcus (in: high G+C Gram-positive bacteria)]KQU06723.1 hypothetical protein ASG56_03585 [Rhodococcus sp. Leaf7]KQU42242.1 hypothetical protein ASG64_03585 [Rhodococcus sp. Leaf247]